MININGLDSEVIHVDSFLIADERITMFGVVAKIITPFLIKNDYGDFVARQISDSGKLLIFDQLIMSLSDAIKNVEIIASSVQQIIDDSAKKKQEEEQEEKEKAEKERIEKERTEKERWGYHV